MTASGPSHGSGKRSWHFSDQIVGALLVAGAFGCALALSAWIHSEVQTSSARPWRPSTEDLVGWPRSVDPVQTLESARRLASGRQLAGLVASGVRVDGHVDAHGPGRVRYVFQSPPGRGPRASGMTSAERARVCGSQTVRLGPSGLVAGADEPGHRCPDLPHEPLPEPQCGPRELWKLALAKGASGTALARAEYYRSVSGPAWSFRVDPGRLSFTVDERCRRELSPSHARRRR